MSPLRIQEPHNAGMRVWITVFIVYFFSSHKPLFSDYSDPSLSNFLSARYKLSQKITHATTFSFV
ncbi:MAG: hypothetical protein SVZ03_11160 [Spirochaetota bacterium]|nr:hypothetical protein [Spirochaetota bacterium]